MKLSIISKYKITSATRNQLSLVPQDPISQLFNMKRALLDVRLPIKGADEIAILNTHLSAFSNGTNALEKQVAQINDHLISLNKANTPWVLGGDFNLLPPNGYPLLAQQQRIDYQPNSAIELLYKNHAALPSRQMLESKYRHHWFTYFPNDPKVEHPDRTIDYYFYSTKLSLTNAFVATKQSQALSDHMPIIATYILP